MEDRKGKLIIDSMKDINNKMNKIKAKMKETVKEGGAEGLKLASVGVVYTGDKVLWDNLGSNRLMFMRYHQEFQKAYKDFANELYENYKVGVDVRKYGVLINANGKEYLFSKDYVTGLNMVSGEDTVFANYIIQHTDLDSKRIKGKYLTKQEAEKVRKVAIEEFIILPTEQDIEFKEKIVTLSLTRPKDWVEDMQRLTVKLGLPEPKMYMEQGDIIQEYEDGRKKKVQWKYDVNSVKEFIGNMCLYWEEDENSNRKPSNEVVRGGGITIVNLTQDQKNYRKYVDEMVEDAVKKSKGVSDVYRINYSNTTTSCYLELTDVGLYDIKISIRDHEEMHEKDYYKFYIDAVGREDFSSRLAVVIDELVRTNGKSIT